MRLSSDRMAKWRGAFLEAFQIGGLDDVIGRLVEEATAAERERLMEVVCDWCGRPTGDPRCAHQPTETSAFCKPVAYAEYLRLHPEAGEGG